MEILGLAIFPMEEEDGTVRWMSVERDEVPYYRWLYLSADSRGEMVEYSAYN